MHSDGAESIAHAAEHLQGVLQYLAGVYPAWSSTQYKQDIVCNFKEALSKDNKAKICCKQTPVLCSCYYILLVMAEFIAIN